MMKRLTTSFAVLVLAWLPGCVLEVPKVMCDELHVEDASNWDLVEELIGRGFEDLDWFDA